MKSTYKEESVFYTNLKNKRASDVQMQINNMLSD